jgi:hypothetical protein
MASIQLKNPSSVSPSTILAGQDVVIEVDVFPTSGGKAPVVAVTIKNAKRTCTSTPSVESTTPAEDGSFHQTYTYTGHGLTPDVYDVIAVLQSETDPAGKPIEDRAQLIVSNQGIAQDRFFGSVMGGDGALPVTLQRAASAEGSDRDEGLWVRILAASEAFSFAAYDQFVTDNFCGVGCGTGAKHLSSGLQSYERLRDVTFEFTKSRCETLPAEVLDAAYKEARARMRRRITPGFDATLPENIEAVRNNLSGRNIPADQLPSEPGFACLPEFRSPCLIELIWSYWHEEAGLVQSMKAISQRFQNLRPAMRDGLATLEIDPLRPLNNFIWGYVQEEQSRLGVLRRAYEYAHAYGVSLEGKATANMRPADRRSKFLEAFHDLLFRCVQFYRQDDDRTVAADAFPVLNAIKGLHYLISDGAHNQHGDLPETARREMLIEQWLLARPEMRDFLRGRAMVPYPEGWMQAVDAMKTLQGWADTSVVHFRDLAVFGERLLLSIRYGGWASANQPARAGAWATFFRAEVQSYIHGYRAVTGVDLTLEPRDTAEQQARIAPPSQHLRRRLASYARG